MHEDIYASLRLWDMRGDLLLNLPMSGWNIQMFNWLCASKNLLLVQKILNDEGRVEYQRRDWHPIPVREFNPSAGQLEAFNRALKKALYTPEDLDLLLRYAIEMNTVRALAWAYADKTGAQKPTVTELPVEWVDTDQQPRGNIRDHIGHGVVPLSAAEFALHRFHPNQYTVWLEDDGTLLPSKEQHNNQVFKSFSAFRRHNRCLLANAQLGDAFFSRWRVPARWRKYHLVFLGTAFEGCPSEKLRWLCLQYSSKRNEWEEYSYGWEEMVPRHDPDNGHCNYEVRVVLHRSARA